MPKGAPEWLETVEVKFPSGRTADELCVTKPADIAWAVQMSTVEFHPWNSRRADVESPDEWRIDLDPMPLATFADVQRTAGTVRDLLDGRFALLRNVHKIDPVLRLPLAIGAGAALVDLLGRARSLARPRWRRGLGGVAAGLFERA